MTKSEPRNVSYPHAPSVSSTIGTTEAKQMPDFDPSKLTHDEAVHVVRSGVKKLHSLLTLQFDEVWAIGLTCNRLKLEVLEGEHPEHPTWGRFCRDVLGMPMSMTDVFIRIVLAPNPRAEFDRRFELARITNEHQRKSGVRRPASGEKVFREYDETTEAERNKFWQLLIGSEWYPDIFAAADMLERRLDAMRSAGRRSQQDAPKTS
jgi:hypothetical protein